MFSKRSCDGLRISCTALSVKSQFLRPTSLLVLPTITQLLLRVIQMQWVKEIPLKWPATDQVQDLKSPVLHLHTPFHFWWFSGRGQRTSSSSRIPSTKPAAPWVRGVTAHSQSKGERLSCAHASCWTWDSARLSAQLMKKVTKLLHRHQTNLVSQTVSSSKPHCK